ncbi:MAG: tetratricopeptide repeat protein [Chloroflexota bacterium]
MGIKEFLKEEMERDIVFRGIRKLRGLTRPRGTTDAWYYKRSRAFLDSGSKSFSPTTAIEYLKQAVRYAPRNAVYHASLGQLFLLAPAWAITRGSQFEFPLRRAAEFARAELEKAVGLAPENVETYYYLALCYEYLGKRDDAKRTCQQAQVHPMQEEMKKFYNAYLEALGRATDLTFADREAEATGHLRQAIGYRDGRNWKLADQEFEKACQAAPNSTWLYKAMCSLVTKS